jgi:hypothetical protein
VVLIRRQLLESDVIFNSLKYDLVRQEQYCWLVSKLRNRVDIWLHEIEQTWSDWFNSGQPFDLDTLAARAEAIRNESLYLPQNHKWKPCTEMKIRKMFNGGYHVSKAFKVADLAENENDEAGKLRTIWKVTYDDDDFEDYEYYELVKLRQGRNRIPAPIFGQPFRMLELCSGRSVVTGESMLSFVCSCDKSHNLVHCISDMLLYGSNS